MTEKELRRDMLVAVRQAIYHMREIRYVSVEVPLNEATRDYISLACDSLLNLENSLSHYDDPSHA